MQTDLETLKGSVVQATRNSPLAGDIADVRLEADHDDDGYAFVRINLRFKDLTQADYAELRKLKKQVEEAWSKSDDRFPSVRFSDAA